MSDIPSEYEEDYGEVEDDNDLEEEIFYEIYVETATNLIHEVQFFSDFCLVRPASPNLYLAIRKLSMMDFSREFKEYLGDADTVRLFLRTAQADFLVDTK